MDDLTNKPDFDRIEKVDLQVEMARSYLDYAMSVIVGRALPDVRDGLKPVHRRVLYAMYDAGYRPDKGYYKSSRIVGDVMGNYHPHGDTAIYDTVVRLAQHWSLRYPLVDGNGNFGSPGNDPAAAMRYTEIRMAKIAHDLLADLDKRKLQIPKNKKPALKTQIRVRFHCQQRGCLFGILSGYSRPLCLISNSAIS